jgi:hypothetical protein
VENGAVIAPVDAHKAQQKHTSRWVIEEIDKALGHDDLAYGWLFRHQY